MNRLIGLSAGIVAAAGLLAIPGTAVATTCPAPGANVTGALIVAPGTSCTIDGVSVGGGVSVGKGATFESYDSTIRGPLNANGAQYLDLCATPIGGVFISNTIDGVHLESSCARGTNASNTTITGGVSLTGNHTGSGCSASCEGDGTVSLFGLRITGTVSVTSNHTEVDISGNRIGGGLLCRDNVFVTDLGSVNMVGGAQTGQCTAAALAGSGTNT
jgi:hypothetical protein